MLNYALEIILYGQAILAAFFMAAAARLLFDMIFLTCERGIESL